MKIDYCSECPIFLDLPCIFLISELVYIHTDKIKDATAPLVFFIQGEIKNNVKLHDN